MAFVLSSPTCNGEKEVTQSPASVATLPLQQNSAVQTANFETPCYLDPTAPVDERVSDLLSRMTLDQKIGQMTLAERSALENIEDIAAYFLGSLLSEGGSAPDPNTPKS